jgi:pimeloyl-ACP methyl ester carboxylesterase
MTGELLSLPGVRLYHEVRGDGPVLLLIPGGNGDAGTFGRLVPALAAALDSALNAAVTG